MNSTDTNFDDAEFAFVVAKTKDGNVKVIPFPEEVGVEGPASLDDVHYACSSVVRNVEAQHAAALVVQALKELNNQPKIVVPKTNLPKR